MKTLSSKIAFLFALYLAAHFAEACIPVCDCPDPEFPYFDYKGIALTTNDPNAAGYLTIAVSMDSVEYVAQASPGFHFMNSAYACKCAEVNGGKGDKYAPMAVDIFADRDFNDTLPAGASLRSIFFGVTGGDLVTTISPDFRPSRFSSLGSKNTLTTHELPKYRNEPYHFKVQWVKSNGDTLVAQTAAVVFQ